MIRLNRIYKELTITLDGLKKGILEIAITTSESTQVAKLLFRIYELEKKLELDELKQYMRREGFTIDDLVPSKNSEVIGKKIRELRLPPGLIIISLIRHDLLIIPHEDMQIDEGDRIFILGLRDRIKEAASLFITAEQFT